MDIIEEIKKLKALLDQGAITPEEFNILKKKVLSGESISIDYQEPATPSSIHKEILSGAISEPKNVLKETKKKSSTVKKPSKKGNRKEDFQEPNEATMKMFKACLVLDLLLGIIFWYRYDSIIAFLICLIISIPLTLITVRLIPKLSLRNLSLIAQIIILLLLIIIPIGNVTNTSSSSSSSSESSSSRDTRTCSWCGKSYTGNGYYHLGSGCVAGDKNLGAGDMCSIKCCMDSWNASHR